MSQYKHAEDENVESARVNACVDEKPKTIACMKLYLHAYLHRMM